ncbi:MAG: DUF4307 domain-containing protein [Rhodoglobus sp.]
MTTPRTDLDARYGRTSSSRLRTRVIVIATAIAFTVVFTLWLVWGGLFGAPAQLQANDTGYTVVDDSTVKVTWELTVPPGTVTQCAVQALNSTFGIVGWKIVDVPASPLLTRDLSEAVRTTEPAVTGLIYRCWLA